MKEIDDKKYILDTIHNLSNNKNTHSVFSDVVICCAYALANASNFSQEREERFNRIIKSYGNQGVIEFASILAHLFNNYSNKKGSDILGEVYEELKLSNGNFGQFFTPLNVCNLMSEITLDKDDTEKELKNQGFISISDPACGSGRLLYSSYLTLLDRGVNSDDILLVGDDVDLLCSCMTYIQLSLTGASAIVNHKNTLTGEVYDTFYTSSFASNAKLQEKVFKQKGVDVEI